ncbi:Uma2 family endonuclease [Streptomyces coelicoflavus]|uniref:Uma2 family endonuclease n=1 Tax=Streptomyces TaxID=1883 RepID=UPI0012929ABA|nr:MULTISPECIES: Uma2 family endonuclease [Streptomyces]MCX5037802.1 Uma2 family endonuclease [Streptomyces coelicoflavus]QFX86394.1 Uma2 family endonuclease [Streptomyces sp. SYP-A7193]
MLVTEFEELARHADRSIEGARLEFINGHLGGRAVPDGDHGRVIQWLTRICMQHRPDLWLDPTQGLVVEAYRGGRARPDGSLAPADAFVGQGEWADPAPVLMVVEVTSYDSDTDRRDRVDKPRAYAGTGIPVYLLIDRDTCEVKVHSRPDGGRYETVQTLPFGKEVALPEPVGIVLDTEPLKNWVR